jgi:hypothetical protein
MDIDDLLEDSEPTGQHTLSKKKNWNEIAKSKLKGSAFDDDLFDDDDFKWTGAPKGKAV